MNDKSDSVGEMTFIKSGGCWSEFASESVKCESRFKAMTVWANSGTDEHQLSHLLSWHCLGRLLFLCLVLGSLEWGFWSSFRSFMTVWFLPTLPLTIMSKGDSPAQSFLYERSCADVKNDVFSCEASAWIHILCSHNSIPPIGNVWFVQDYISRYNSFFVQQLPL